MSNSTQQKWILDVYKNLGLIFSKVTHVGWGPESRIAETLNIDKEQIQHAGNWNTDSMHKGYLTNLPCKFMHGMAKFDPNHPGTYHIARATIQLSEKLLFSFWCSLNKWVNIFFKILQLLNLLNCFYICILYFFKTPQFFINNFLVIHCFLIFCFWCWSMEFFQLKFCQIWMRKKQIKVY